MTVVFQHILVAVDGSESSLHAADAAIELAALLHARLDILSVEETAPRYVATQEESSIEQSAAAAYYERLHEPLRRKAERRGIRVQCVIVSGHEGQSVLDYIMQQQCDLLVLGYRGHSAVWGAFLGSTADKLVSQSPCSTLVIRSKWGKALFRHILVALDCSPLSWQGFQVSLYLGKQVGAFVHVLSVVETTQMPPLSSTLSGRPGEWDWRSYFQQAQALAEAELQLAGLKTELLTSQGSASAAITAAARDKGIDLVVLGATGQEHPWSTITGGTARKVANAAPCAVLIVRPLARRLHVCDVMNTRVVPVKPDTGLSEIIERLIVKGERLLVVVDNHQRVVGVVTLGHLLSHEAVMRHLDLQRATGTGHLERYVDHLVTMIDAAQTAKDVMSKHPLVVADNVSLEEAARHMDAEHVTRMPVLDATQHLVGILDQAHVLSYFADLPVAPETPSDHHVIDFPHIVGECALAQTPLVGADTPLFEVLRQVQETPLRRVIVVDLAGKAIGVVADSDILAARGLITRQNPVLALAGRLSLRFPEEFLRRITSSGPLTAQQVMRSHLFAVTPVTPVAEAVRLMLAHHIKRLVVVDDQGKPVGMVDRQHLLRALIGGDAASI